MLWVVPPARSAPCDRAGLVDTRCGTVEELEVGEAACEASDSTSSIECACHPWLTFTIA